MVINLVLFVSAVEKGSNYHAQFKQKTLADEKILINVPELLNLWKTFVRVSQGV